MQWFYFVSKIKKSEYPESDKKHQDGLACNQITEYPLLLQETQEKCSVDNITYYLDICRFVIYLPNLILTHNFQT